jgi:hypothetical protein
MDAEKNVVATTPQPRKRRPGPRPGTPEARRGGLAAAARLGSEGYRAIGRAGGRTVRDRHGLEYYTRIGLKGGATTKARHGSEHYRRIGKIGGATRHKHAAPQAGRT